MRTISLRTCRSKLTLWPTLAIVCIVLYLATTFSFMVKDHSISTFGFVHNSDRRIGRFLRNTVPGHGRWSPAWSSCDADVEVVNNALLGGGCFFRDRIQCEGMPTIHSAFADVVEKNVVFIATRFRDDAWVNDTFICEFPDGNLSVADPIAIDDRSMGNQPQYISVITCPIPEQFYESHRPQKMLPDKFAVHLKMKGLALQEYRNIPLCKSGWKKAHYLSICTMVKDVDKYFEDWLLYYRYMGVEHVYVYDNSDHGTLLAVLDRFIKLGFVTVIPWSQTFTPTKTYLEVQIAHENDCLWRHRHDTEWMLKIDVDEFVQPLFERETKLVDFLRNFETTLPTSIAVIRVRNWFFSRPPSNVGKQIMTANSVIERNPWRSPEPTGEGRGREKCFIRPKKVHYFKIHAVKLGAESLTLDPYTEMRLVHYRSENPRHRNFHIHKFVPDTSMVMLWRAINRWVLYAKDRVIVYGYRKHRYKT